MVDLEMRYTKVKQMILALVMVAQKLRPYLQAYVIIVLTNFHLRLIMTQSNTSGKMIRWPIELREFDIQY